LYSLLEKTKKQQQTINFIFFSHSLYKNVQV